MKLPDTGKILIIVLISTLFWGRQHPVYSQSNSDIEIETLKQKSMTVSVEAYKSTLKICKFYWNSSFDSSIVYAHKAVLISNKLQNDSLESLAAIYLALSFYRIDQLDSVIYYCGVANTKSERYPRLNAKANSILGISYRRLGNFNKALKYGRLSIKTFKNVHDSINFASALGNVSVTLQEMGNAPLAIEYSLKAAGIFEALKDSFDLAKQYGTLANIYLDLSDPETGSIYYRRGMSLIDSTEYKELYVTFVFNMATVYHQLQKYDSAIYFYNLSLKHYKQNNDREGVAIAYQNIGISLVKKLEYRQAIRYLRNAYLLFSNLFTIRNVSDVLADLGRAYLGAGINDSAIMYLQMSVDTALQYNLPREELKARKLLYNVYKSEKKYSNALANFEKYKLLEDSIYSQKTKEKMAELTMKYETGLKDQKINRLILNEKITKAKTRTYLIFIISVSIVIILISVILYYRKRTQNKMLSIKSKLWEKEKAELDKELTFKKQQLSAHALHMTQKNKLLQNIRSSINSVMPMVPESAKSKIRELRYELNKSLRYDKDWEVFSMYFNELNKDFFDKLISVNPALNQYDLRLAALVRMNMNIKEAAAVLNIEPDSVKTARYKLRKKLNLRQEDDLYEFMRKV